MNKKMKKAKLKEAIDFFNQRNWLSDRYNDYSDLSHVQIVASVIGKPLRSVKVYANVIDMQIEFTVEGTLYRKWEFDDFDELLEAIFYSSQEGLLVVYGYSDEFFATRTLGKTLCSIDDWYVEVDLKNFEFPGGRIDEAIEVFNNFRKKNYGCEERYREHKFHNLTNICIAELDTDDGKWENWYYASLIDMRLEILMEDADRVVQYSTVGELLDFISNCTLDELKTMACVSDKEFEEKWHGETIHY